MKKTNIQYHECARPFVILDEEGFINFDEAGVVEISRALIARETLGDAQCAILDEEFANHSQNTRYFGWERARDYRKSVPDPKAGPAVIVYAEGKCRSGYTVERGSAKVIESRLYGNPCVSHGTLISAGREDFFFPTGQRASAEACAERLAEHYHSQIVFRPYPGG